MILARVTLLTSRNAREVKMATQIGNYSFEFTSSAEGFLPDDGYVFQDFFSCDLNEKELTPCVLQESYLGLDNFEVGVRWNFNPQCD